MSETPADKARIQVNVNLSKAIMPLSAREETPAWRTMLAAHLRKDVLLGKDLLEFMSGAVVKTVQRLVPSLEWAVQTPKLFDFLDRMPESDLLARVLFNAGIPLHGIAELEPVFAAPIALEKTASVLLQRWLDSAVLSMPLVFWLQFHAPIPPNEWTARLTMLINRANLSEAELAEILYNTKEEIASGIRRDIPDYCVLPNLAGRLWELVLASRDEEVHSRFRAAVMDSALPDAFWPEQIRAAIYPPIELSAKHDLHIEIPLPSLQVCALDLSRLFGCAEQHKKVTTE